MKHSPLVASLLCATALYAAPAIAQDADQDDGGEAIIVTGEKEPGDLIVDAEELERTSANSLEDIFANESSIAVGGGSATAQKIYVRGFEDVMLNVTVDGAQSPGELYHHQGRVQLEPDFIKTIELDAGAGVATNGSGALTGALRVELKDAFDMLRPGQDVGAYAKGTARFNGGDGYGGSAAIYGRLGDNVGLIAGASYSERKDYTDGHGNLVEATPYDHLRFFSKFNVEDGDHTASLTFEKLDDGATTFERPNLTNFAGRYILSDQEMNRLTLAGNYRYNPAIELVDVKATAYFNTTDFRVQRQTADIIYNEGEFSSMGLDLRNTSVFGDLALTYGVDYRVDDLEAAQNATPPFAWGDTRQSVDVFGAYMQANFQPIDALTLSAGVRYDEYSFSGTGGVSNGVGIADSGVSPNIGATLEIIDGLELRAQYAQAFRGVQIREAFFSALYVHDGSLESEKADNLEFGISFERDGFFARGTWYKQNIDNFIDIEYVGGDVWGYWRNIGDAKVEGYELEAGYATRNLFLSAGMWDADNTLNGEPLVDSNLGLGTSIGRTWLAKAEYTGLGDRLHLGAQLRHVDAEPNLIADGAPDKEAYTTVKAYVDYQLADPVTVSLVVNNLFDEFYYDHATYTFIGGATNDYAGYPAMGREVVLSLRAQF